MGTGFVVFTLGERVFATALDDVREIVRLQGLQRLPGTKAPLAGIIVLRGVPLPVLDVRQVGSPGDTGDVLVVAGDGDLIGVAVDSVLAVLRAEELPEQEWPNPRSFPGYVIGVRTAGDGPVLLVDLERLLDVVGPGWQAALNSSLPVTV